MIMRYNEGDFFEFNSGMIIKLVKKSKSGFNHTVHIMKNSGQQEIKERKVDYTWSSIKQLKRKIPYKEVVALMI